MMARKEDGRGPRTKGVTGKVGGPVDFGHVQNYHGASFERRLLNNGRRERKLGGVG